jgi:pimeloyl-ACP methyl ester carboxylesterase
VSSRSPSGGGEVRSFTSFDGVAVAYRDVGHGAATLLLHGFASDSRTNWIRSGVADALLESGRRVVMVDARGHGASDKPHRASAYGSRSMARDASALLDLLGIDEVDVIGYSMGSLVAMEMAVSDERVRSLVLGGIGAAQATRLDPLRASRIADALEAPDKSTITDPTALAFRNFADATGADRLALTAIQRASPRPPPREVLASIDVPILVLNGRDDTLAGPIELMAEVIPRARLLVVPGDHLSAVMKPEFGRSIVEFLDSR